MNLISALAAGVGIAPAGTCVLNKRGTSTRASYYKDFEASQVYTAQPIALDSGGSAVLYVSELVDVLVYDASGTLVREFVAGSYDAAVEVISPSFTGVSYSDGSSGVSKPTTLEKVLDAWITSAGAPDFNVKPAGGATITLSAATAALSSVYFNVKTYGAIGNGVADDSVAITAAVTAAQATSTGGGTVLFPPGTYRCASTLAWPAGIAMLGAGGSASKLMFDNTGGQNMNLSPGTALTTIQGMYISAQNIATTFTLLRVITAGRLNILDCTVGGDTQAQGGGMQMLISGGATVVARTRFISAGGVAALVSMSQAASMRFVECDFINNQTTGITHVVGAPGFEAIGCNFSCDAATAGTTTYFNWDGSIAVAVYEQPLLVGNTFADGIAVNATAILNSAAATPTYDVVEWGNNFGNNHAFTGFRVTPYAHTIDGYAPLTSGIRVGCHGSRFQRQETIIGAVASADPKSCANTTVLVTAGAALSVSATKGCRGDRWTLNIVNTSGGAVTVTPDATAIVLDAGSISYNVASGGRAQRIFEWLPVVAGTTPGRWTQVATATNI